MRERLAYRLQGEVAGDVRERGDGNLEREIEEEREGGGEETRRL